MNTTIICIEAETYQRLADLSASQHRPMAHIVADAIAIYEKQLFWKLAEEGYQRMNADPEDRAAFDAEIAAWDSTIADGLADSPFNEPIIHPSGSEAHE